MNTVYYTEEMIYLSVLFYAPSDCNVLCCFMLCSTGLFCYPDYNALWYAILCSTGLFCHQDCNVLCCFMLCFTGLFCYPDYNALLYPILCSTGLFCYQDCNVLYCFILCSTVLFCDQDCNVLFSFMLCSTGLLCYQDCNVLFCFILCSTGLLCYQDCNGLYCFILCSTGLFCLARLQCFVLFYFVLHWFCFVVRIEMFCSMRFYDPVVFSVCPDFNVLCWFILCSTGLFCYQDCNVIYYFVFPWFVLWIQIAMCCAILFYVLLNAFSNWCFIAILPQWLNMLQPNGYGLLLLYYAYKHPTYCCRVRIWNNNGFLCKAW
jgi:hypothetical protein